MSSACICFNGFPLLQSHTGSYRTSLLLSAHVNSTQSTIQIPTENLAFSCKQKQMQKQSHRTTQAVYKKSGQILHVLLMKILAVFLTPVC